MASRAKKAVDTRAKLKRAARRLSKALKPYRDEPCEKAPHVLDPLDYAWKPHAAFLERFAPSAPGEVEAVLVGMNPGPWGMAQTGIPFGSPDFVRDFLGLEGKVRVPENTHPKRPIIGLESTRTEVSGQRLWGGVEACFGEAEAFFERFFVLNYCPLVWQNERGANVTPDKLGKAYMADCEAACDKHLGDALALIGPATAIGVGKWAEKRLLKVKEQFDLELKVGSILHPSPASPIANRGWLPQALSQLEALGHPWPQPQ